MPDLLIFGAGTLPVRIQPSEQRLKVIFPSFGHQGQLQELRPVMFTASYHKEVRTYRKETLWAVARASVSVQLIGMANIDLDLKLDVNSVQGYNVEVIGSSLQRTNSQPLLLPTDVMEEVQQARNRHDRALNTRLGQKLFDALLPGPIRDIWCKSKGISSKSIVRLRLDIRSNELQKIPWELLHDGRSSLSLTEKLPI